MEIFNMNHIIRKPFNLGYIVLLSLVIFILIEIVYRTTWLTVHNPRNFEIALLVCRVLMLSFLVLYLISDFSYKFLFYIFALVVVSFFVYKSNHDYFLFDLFAFPLFITKYLRKSVFYNLFFYTYIFGIVATAILYYLDILPHNEVFFRGENTIRYSLGFLHPNTLGMFCIFVGMLFFVKIKKLSITNSLFFVFLSLFCYFVPNSISATFLILFLLVLAFICNYIDIQQVDKTKIFFTICFLVSLVFFVVLFVGTTGYGEGFIRFFPGELWARFTMGNDALQKYGFSLFGNHEILQSTIVDSAYYYLILVKGIIPTLFYVLFYVMAIKKSLDYNDIRLLVIQLLVLIYGLSENVICFPYVMFAFVSLSYSSFSKNEF